MPRFSSSSGRQTLVSLKQKKKSLADAVNEQLTASAMGGGRDSDAFDYADGGAAEDYDFDSAGDSDDMNGYGNDGDYDDDDGRSGSRKASSRAAAKSGGVTSKAKGSKKSLGLLTSSSSSAASSSSSRLRHRGPLDASLSEGKYAATPVNVEAAMDDIFGALDMGDMDAEGEEFYDDDENMDGSDLYGGDDEEGDEEDGDEDDDEEEDADMADAKATKKKKKEKAASAATRKRRRAKDLTEEEYAAWLEKKSSQDKKAGKLRRPLSFGAPTDGNDAAMSSEEADILRQLNELRQNQHVHLVSTGDSAAAAAAAAGGVGDGAAAATAAESDAKATRDAVQHFIMVYGQLLRLRVLLQPAVTRAMSLPQYYAKSLFVKPNRAVDEAAVAEASSAEEGRRLVEQLAEQREAAADRYEAVQAELESVLATLYGAAVGNRKGSSNGDGEDEDGAAGSSEAKHKRARLDVPSYRNIESYHERTLRHANHCLEYWGAKLVQANSAKLKTIAQPLPQQIAAILTAKSRLRTKVQKNRSHLAILAHPEHVRAATSAEAKAQRALHMAEGDVDGEIYDDADFLRELVRRGGAVANQLEQKVKEMQQALLPSRDGARKGFHRMTKGKAVNYEPRPKLVGFMMAESLDDTPRNDVVVRSLFQ